MLLNVLYTVVTFAVYLLVLLGAASGGWGRLRH